MLSRHSSIRSHQSKLDDTSDETSLAKQVPMSDQKIVQEMKSKSLPAELLQPLQTVEDQPPYSIYTSHQKAFIVFMSAVGGFTSPLSANTYLPALPIMADFLNVSGTLINLTVTAFLIFQGLAPSFYGDLADIAGRRPAYLVSFVVYIAANIGLATQSSYAALFVLRCLQVRMSPT